MRTFPLPSKPFVEGRSHVPAYLIQKVGRVFEIRHTQTDAVIAYDTSYRAALARVQRVQS